ncbi:unnamed protein product [Peniophora sp. CBMAI 1063]|nr:unnamed protein product [Peniophora sp. CBMAI 1063]
MDVPFVTEANQNLFTHYDWDHRDGDDCIFVLEVACDLPDPECYQTAVTLIRRFVPDPAGGTFGPPYHLYPGFRELEDVIDTSISTIARLVMTLDLGFVNIALRSIAVLYSLYGLRQKAMYNQAMLDLQGQSLSIDELFDLVTDKARLAYQSGHIVQHLFVIDELVNWLYYRFRRNDLTRNLIINVGGLCLKIIVSHRSAQRWYFRCWVYLWYAHASDFSLTNGSSSPTKS